MHHLHFVLVRAESTKEAARFASCAVNGQLPETMGANVGGVASEDGNDDVVDFDDGIYPLSFLDTENVPQEGTYFSRTAAFLFSMFRDSVPLDYMPQASYPDIDSALQAIVAELKKFDARTGSERTLPDLARNLIRVNEVIESRLALKNGTDIPGFYSGQYAEEGLTRLDSSCEDGQRYIVFLDIVTF